MFLFSCLSLLFVCLSSCNSQYWSSYLVSSHTTDLLLYISLTVAIMPMCCDVVRKRKVIWFLFTILVIWSCFAWKTSPWQIEAMTWATSVTSYTCLYLSLFWFLNMHLCAWQDSSSTHSTILLASFGNFLYLFIAEAFDFWACVSPRVVVLAVEVKSMPC